MCASASFLCHQELKNTFPKMYFECDNHKFCIGYTYIYTYIFILCGRCGIQIKIWEITAGVRLVQKSSGVSDHGNL